MDILRIIIVSCLGAFLLFVGKHDFMISYLIDHSVIDATKDYSSVQLGSFIVGLMITALWFPLEVILCKRSLSRNMTVLSSLLEYNKTTYLSYLGKELSLNRNKFQVRLFVPKSTIIDLFKGETTLVIKDVPGITDSFHSTRLHFRCSKHVTEGMVGKAYKEKALCIDLDLSDNNTYTLTEQQKLLTNGTMFCCTVPIMSNNKVIAVVSYDSQVAVKEHKREKLQEHLIYFTSFIDKHISV